MITLFILFFFIMNSNKLMIEKLGYQTKLVFVVFSQMMDYKKLNLRADTQFKFIKK